ncbi:MAG TPA: hypothetical protein VLF94_05080 [Chlamydiales bacterium]|nr:hypothetical protein [Chlamydiales bacterium]
MPRRRPEFGPGVAGSEAAQLEQVERCRRLPCGVHPGLNSVAADAGRNRLLKLFVCIN